MIAHVPHAWQQARDHIQIVQAKQKRNYDKFKKATPPNILEGDCIMLYIPVKQSDKPFKFERPFRRPNGVVRVLLNVVELVSISKPKAHSIRLSLD